MNNPENAEDLATPALAMTRKMDQERTLVIVPTYNERENISALIEQILRRVRNADVLVIDDNSPDGTADHVMKVFSHETRCSVLRRKGLRGYGLSCLDGYRYALKRDYTRLVQIDADFSHDPKSIPDLINANKGADVVVGSRYCPEGSAADWPVHRRLLSWLANGYISKITGVNVRDATTGFRCYNRRAVETIVGNSVMSEGYSILVEATYIARKAGLSIVEVPITFLDRREGKSKMSVRVIFESILMPWRLRFRGNRN